MAVDNYKTVPKMGIEKMVKEALEKEYIISNPIEHYSIEEIKKLSILANKNDLILSIKEETSNFYQGILIGLVKRAKIEECKYLIRHL